MFSFPSTSLPILLLFFPSCFLPSLLLLFVVVLGDGLGFLVDGEWWRGGRGGRRRSEGQLGGRDTISGDERRERMLSEWEDDKGARGDGIVIV